ncbi:TetR/AcrR family transcriptional regulator, partial [Mycobacteroides abscessus subsp. abscessus]|nr:TetR/AcrR family transcriptional regulator [Mycobacteroides abscessus subsp. abscessus]MBN7552135.1 TetR/AcrR family transcriptional regulator [Mycobacteroides abscessus subsp. abscessus]
DPATTMTEVADTIATMFSGIVLGDVPLSRAAANG